MNQRQARQLLDWYRAEARALPWRETRDPYRILVSEVMLQQTQVETVKPYYHRFLERFPDFRALAESPTDEVLGRWSGLGYYSRARRLQQTARAVVERGSFPGTEEELARLPGIGPYTAAALASIAFGRKALALDTNAVRVLTRLLAIQESPQKKTVQKQLRESVLPSVPEDSAGDFTQALMELGATRCKVRKPACADCPWTDSCLALRDGLIEKIPPPKAKPAKVDLTWVAALVRESGRCLLHRRSQAPLKGLWLPPLAEDLPQLERNFQLRDLGLVGETRHGITFRRIRTLVYTAEHRGTADTSDLRWFTQEEMEKIGLPSYARKILDLC